LDIIAYIPLTIVVDKMKYSFLFPYYQRTEIRIALLSFQKFYNRSDFEVIIIEDLKNVNSEEHHTCLLKIIAEFREKMNIVHLQNDVVSYNASRSFNIGANYSNAEVLMISNPETYHKSDFLKVIDNEDLSKYLICSCMLEKTDQDIFAFNDLEKFNFEFIEWYQHGQYNPSKFHWCSFIKRDLYLKIGGFDENYLKGLGYDDNDFIRNIQYNKIEVKHLDDLVSSHVLHKRQYQEDLKYLYQINQQYFLNKWRNL